MGKIKNKDTQDKGKKVEAEKEAQRQRGDADHGLDNQSQNV
jgi:hypothetical protein